MKWDETKPGIYEAVVQGQEDNPLYVEVFHYPNGELGMRAVNTLRVGTPMNIDVWNNKTNYFRMRRKV